VASHAQRNALTTAAEAWSYTATDSASCTLTNRIAALGGRITPLRYASFAPLNPTAHCVFPKDSTSVPKTARNSFRLKILPLSCCSPKIFPAFSPNPMISIDRGGGLPYITKR
jgi:hypothetical protein